MRGVVSILIFLMLFSSIAIAIEIDPEIEKKLLSNEKVKVIVTLKEDSGSKALRMNSFVNDKKSFKLSNLEKQKSVLSTLSKNEFLIANRHSLIPAFSGKINKQGLEKLKQDSRVESVVLDRKLHAFLDGSVNSINASKVWNLSYDGTNITGSGQTVCVIDTGIDYTHEAFGDCNAEILTIIGNNQTLSTPVESAHNYGNSINQTWVINGTNFTQIAVFFENIETEASWDYVYIEDSNGTVYATYTDKGVNFWSPSVSGNNLTVRLVSDNNTVDYGFRITKILNGSVNYSYNWSNCSSIVGGYNIFFDNGNPIDYQSHGTHVSGIITSNNLTYQGVAYNSKIYSVRVMDHTALGSGYLSDINYGIETCINQSSQYNISVISMSIGGGSFNYECDNETDYSSTRELVNLAYYNNISVIAASGNNGDKNGIAAPACLANITSVGNVDKSDGTVSGSQAATILDFFAPGQSIRSTILSSSFGLKSGTSMATPHVAASYALLRQFGLLELNKVLTPSELYTAFNSTGTIINDSGFEKPRIDVYAALLSLDDVTPTINYVSPTPANGASLQNNTNISIRINTSETLSNATIIYNVTTYQMTKDGDEWFFNVTFNYSTSFNVTATDMANNSYTLETRSIYINNLTVILTIYPNSSTVNISEPNNQTFNVTFEDSNNDEVNISWFLDGILQSVGINNSEYNFTGNYSTEGNHNVTVSLFNGIGYSTNYWNLSVNGTDTTPTIDSNVPLDLSINETDYQFFNHSSSDVDGDSLSYQWLLNGSLQSNNIFWNYTSNYSSANFWNVTLIVSDPQGNNDSLSWNMTVLNVNRAPVWNSFVNQSVRPNETLNYSLDVSDLDGDSLIFYVNDTNVTISNSNLLYTPVNFTGTFSINVTASDNISNSSALLTITVNAAPTFNSTIPGFSWAQGASKSNAFNLSNYFNDTDNLSFGYEGNSNINIAVSNAIVSFFQSSSWSGSESVRFFANDSYGVSYSNYITLTVTATPSSDDDSSSSSSSTSSAPAIVSDSITKVWFEINAGDVKTLTVNKEELPVSSIVFKAKESVSNFELTVKKLSSKPSTPKALNKRAHSFIEIKMSVDVEIEEVTIDFEVEKEWLENFSIDKEMIALYRYTDDWDQLPTNITGENDSLVFYSATTPGFSYFAIGETLVEDVEPIVDPNESENANNSKPVFEIQTADVEDESQMEPEIKIPSSVLYLLAIIILYVLAGKPAVKFWNKNKELPRHLLEKHNIHKPHDDVESLKHAISKIKKHHSKHKIKKSLAKKGWHEDKIKEAFKK